MEIKDCSSMLVSNDQRFIKRFIKRLNGKFWIADYVNKIIKHGNFLNNTNLNGGCKIIKYDTNVITIESGEFTDGVSDFSLKKLNSTYTHIESQNPYFIYNNTVFLYF